MKVRTIKKRIKALKGKFNVGINYTGLIQPCGQPNIHKHGVALQIRNIEFEFIPWTMIKGVRGLTDDEV